MFSLFGFWSKIGGNKDSHQATCVPERKIWLAKSTIIWKCCSTLYHVDHMIRIEQSEFLWG